MSHSEVKEIYARPLPVRWSLMTMLAVIATIAWLCGAAVIAQGVDASRPSGGTWITAGAAILAVYYWRFQIGRSQQSRAVKLLIFIGVLMLLLPYIYGTAGLIADWARLPISKWIGDPTWVYAVPITSFALLDLRRKSTSPATYLLHSGAELLVVIPAWTYIWIIGQQHLGWWWM